MRLQSSAKTVPCEKATKGVLVPKDMGVISDDLLSSHTAALEPLRGCFLYQEVYLNQPVDHPVLRCQFLEMQ